MSACSHPEDQVVPLIGKLLVCKKCNSTVTGPGGEVCQKLQVPSQQVRSSPIREVRTPTFEEFRQSVSRALRFAR